MESGGSGQLIKFPMGDDFYGENMKVPEEAVENNDSNGMISPQWGWYVAITPPAEFYIREVNGTSTAVTSKLQNN
jgi:hypothetical protein